MEIIDYYEGFEGYPEIKLIRRDKSGNVVTLLKIWEGYFDSIITLIEPNEEGNWEGVAFHYHLTTGWYDEPWRCDDVGLFLQQLEAVDEKNLKDSESLKILKTLILLLENTLNSNGTLTIERE